VTARGLQSRLVAAAGFVGAVLILDSWGVLSEDVEVVVDNAAQLLAGAAATGACWWTSRRVQGIERTWRRLMTIGMAGWSVGQALWSWYQVFSDTPLPSPSLADVGYLMMPVFALPALLVLDTEPPRRDAEALRGDRVVFFLDGAMIVGSLFVLTWATTLGAVVDAEAPSPLALVVAISYPVTDLMLVVIVVMLAVARRVPRPMRPQLGLLGWGLVGISLSDSIFAYLVSSGAEEMPPLTNAGFIGGPLLIAVAAMTTASGWPVARHMQRPISVDRAHLLLPYGLVALTGSVVAAQAAVGARIDPLEAILAGLVVGLVLVRQVVTILENAALLERVSAAQDELSYRAHHDPLTGLANRALFGDHLEDAVERHRRSGGSFALLVVDLDDFKAVNDALGHASGDRLLTAVGERLRGCVREADTVARLGGDEFAVLLDGDVEAPGTVAERILAALYQPFRIDGHLVSVGASVGVVEPELNELDVTADVLVHRADGAMYLGKRRGKGTVVHYRPELRDDLPGVSHRSRAGEGSMGPRWPARAGR
jgi:diguanylate cyclase (GGDEF)-like protein